MSARPLTRRTLGEWGGELAEETESERVLVGVGSAMTSVCLFDSKW